MGRRFYLFNCSSITFPTRALILHQAGGLLRLCRAEVELHYMKCKIDSGTQSPGCKNHRAALHKPPVLLQQHIRKRSLEFVIVQMVGRGLLVI